jgi:tetratricopeptide (TPR) repeat protein
MKVIIGIILFFFNSLIYSQTIDETIILADELFLKKEFVNALNLYKRVDYFNPDLKIKEKIADCYFNTDEYENALSYYKSLDSLFEKESSHFVKYKQIDCYIFLKKYNNAEKLIKSFEMNNVENDYKYNFYSGLIYFLKSDFKQAEYYFLNTLPDTCLKEKDEILFIFNTKKIGKPNPETAFYLSTIIPGAGQLYAGDFRNALNSFMLVGVLTWISVDMYKQLAWFDPLISIFPWLNRYYKGSSENARKIAEEKRALHLNQILNDVISIIQETENK